MLPLLQTVWAIAGPHPLRVAHSCRVEQNCHLSKELASNGFSDPMPKLQEQAEMVIASKFTVQIGDMFRTSHYVCLRHDDLDPPLRRMLGFTRRVLLAKRWALGPPFAAQRAFPCCHARVVLRPVCVIGMSHQ